MKYIVFDCDGTLIDTSTPKYQLFPGIKQLISELAADHLLYVWTARDRESTLRILTENEIHHFFAGLSTISDAPSKPNIAGLLTLLGSVSKSSVCVIGDSPHDMLGAKRFGALSIGAVWNTETSAALLTAAGADFIVSHPSECSKLVELNLKGAPHV
jgi:phosphoglycolate phosphatase